MTRKIRASSSYVNAAPPPPDLFRIDAIEADADVPVDCVNEGMIGGGACKFVIVQLTVKKFYCQNKTSFQR